MGKKEVLVPPQWLIDPRGEDFMEAIGVEVDFLGQSNEYARKVALVLDLVVETLPDPQREAVEAVVWARLSYRDAGAMLACDPKTVWRRMQKAAELVQQQLERPLQDLLDLEDEE